MKAKIEFKQQQLDVLRAVFDGKDTIAVMPTCFGKSLLFQMLPFLMAVPVQKFPFAITIDFINLMVKSKLLDDGYMGDNPGTLDTN